MKTIAKYYFSVLFVILFGTTTSMAIYSFYSQDKEIIVPLEEQKGFNSFKSMTEAKEYYNDEGFYFFECGQGFFQDEVTTNCFIQNSFFKVTLLANIESAKQNVGERLYWVGNLKEIERQNADFKEFQTLKIKEKEELIAQKKE